MSIDVPGKLTVCTSADGSYWDIPTPFLDYSDVGLQMTVFKNELWGIYSKYDPKASEMYASKCTTLDRNRWSTPIKLPQQARGRAAVAVLGDRLWVAYRGATNSSVWLISTNDFQTWSTPIKLGDYITLSSPALQVYDGKLFVAARSEDYTVAWWVGDQNGKTLMDWNTFTETNTMMSPHLAVCQGRLHLFYVHYTSAILYLRVYNATGSVNPSSWTAEYDLGATRYYGSAVSSVVWKPNQLAVFYKDEFGGIASALVAAGKFAGSGPRLSTKRMTTTCGAGFWNGKLFVSWGDKDPMDRD